MFFDGGSRENPAPPAPRRPSGKERALVVSMLLIGFALLLLPISAGSLVDLVRWWRGG